MAVQLLGSWIPSTPLLKLLVSEAKEVLPSLLGAWLLGSLVIALLLRFALLRHIALRGAAP